MEVYIGQILPWAIPFAPKGWALCNGQTLTVAQNMALFAVIGTKYGGDGRVNFALPNLGSRLTVCADPFSQVQPMMRLSNGTAVGAPTASLAAPNLASHTHGAGTVDMQGTPTLPTARAAAANQMSPGPGAALGTTTTVKPYATGKTPDTAIAGLTVTSSLACQVAGAGTPIPLLPPFLGLNFIICVSDGYFPSYG